MATTLGCQPFTYDAAQASLGLFDVCVQVIPNGTMVFVPDVLDGKQWSVEQELASFQGVAAAFRCYRSKRVLGRADK